MRTKIGLRRKVRKTVATVSFCTLYTSCATLIGGTEDKIEITSTPVGAKVYANDEFIGMTPLTANFNRSMPEANLTIEKQGFEKENVKLEKEFNALTTLNLVNIFFWGADAMMGNLKKFSDSKIQTTLKKTTSDLKEKSKALLGKNQVQTDSDSKTSSKRRDARNISSL